MDEKGKFVANSETEGVAFMANNIENEEATFHPTSCICTSESNITIDREI